MEWQSDSRSHSRTQAKNPGIKKLKDEWVWQPVKLGPAGQYGSHQTGELLEDGVHPCGFCSGTGQKPRGSKCSVCRGTGTVCVEPPAVTCAYCKGGGEEKPRSNITCTACRGKGVIHVDEPIEICSHCRGTGKEPTNKLVCVKCRGKGVVTVKEEEGFLGPEEEGLDVTDSFIEDESEGKVQEEPVRSASVSEHEASEAKESSQAKVEQEPVRSASGSEREALEVVKKSGQADAVAVARKMSPPVSSGYAKQLCDALVKKRLLTRDRTLYGLTPNGEKALGNFVGG